MRHSASEEDRRLQAGVESCTVTPAQFDHRAHVRLAYVYLTQHDAESAHDRMRGTLRTFLQCHGVTPTKYHETITRAWILAVRHFMEKTEATESADAFIDRNPEILDAKIMLTHYSADLLFSDSARHTFIEPDRAPIPRHNP